MAEFKAFLRELRGFSGATRASVEEVSSALRSAESGIGTLDTILHDADVANRNGIVLVGREEASTTIGNLDRLLREGNLEGVARALGRRDVPITTADEAAFRQLVRDTPESALRDVSDVALANRRNLPELDVTAERIDTLSSSGRQTLSRVQSNLLKYFKRGTILTLTIGTVYVSVDWIAKAMRARRGCFMLTTVNGKTSSCKIGAFTCLRDSFNEGVQCTGFDQSTHYNVTLTLMHIVDLPDTDKLKVTLAKYLSYEPSELKEKLGEIIDKRFDRASDWVRNMGTMRPTFSVCAPSHPQVEGGKIPPCRMCSPTDSPTSTTFADPRQYGDNITFQCVPDPSVLDIVSDVIVSTGKNILDGITGFALGPLKTIGIIAAVVIGLGILLYLLVRFLPRRTAGAAGGGVSSFSSYPYSYSSPSRVAAL